jgi:preprotein translocase SecE subunit
MKQPTNGSGKKPAPKTSAPTQQQVRRAGVFAYLISIRDEMKRVTWPTREEWVTATVLTIGLVVVVGLFTAGCDHLFGWIIATMTGQSTR